MIVLALRALVRVIAFVVLLGGAVAVAATGVMAASSADGVERLARTVGLPDLHHRADDLLRAVEAPGSAALLTALAAAGCLLGGLAVLVGVLAPRREHLVAVKDDDALSARRRALAAALKDVVAKAPGVGEAKVRLHVAGGRFRRLGGRVRVRATPAAATSPEELRAALATALEPIAGPFGLRTKVRVRAVPAAEAALRAPSGASAPTTTRTEEPAA